MIEDIDKLNLSPYGIQIDVVSTRIANVSGINAGMNEISITMEMSMPMTMDQKTANDGFKDLIRDLALLNKIKGNTHPGVNEQYDKLITIFALSEDY